MQQTSQSKGELKLGCLKMLSIRSGRPMSKITLIGPTMRANTVIASAMRVMGLRHS